MTDMHDVQVDRGSHHSADNANQHRFSQTDNSEAYYTHVTCHCNDVIL